MSLDAARLGEIRERLDKATPGPWRVNGAMLSVYGDSGCVADPFSGITSGPSNPGPANLTGANADLIANAPTDLADLLAAHEALTAQVAALREALEWVAQHRTYDKEHMERPLKDTAAAAEAFKRQQRLEGARELVRDMGGYPGTEHIALADMERDESA